MAVPALDAQIRAPSRALVPAPAELGVRGGRDFDEEVWLFGVQYRMPIDAWGRVQLMPSADLILLENNTAWQVNVDANVDLFPGGMLYAGGGLAILTREDADEELARDNGWNLHVGVRPFIPAGRLTPYVEARWTLVESTSVFRLMFGINKPIGPWRAPPARR